MEKLHYGFLDESGILEAKAMTGNFFVVSVILVGNPGELKHVIKHARRKAKDKFKTHSVFKASKENKGFVKLILQELAKCNIDIVIGVWDKRNGSLKKDKNLLYAEIVSQAVAVTLEKYPMLNLVIHKRYTLPRIREQLNRKLSEVATVGTFLSVSQQTEIECRQLELADAVAWAVFQKYNHKTLEFYNIIEHRIQIENRLAA